VRSEWIGESCIESTESLLKQNKQLTGVMDCVQDSALMQAVAFIANLQALAESRRLLIKATLKILRLSSAGQGSPK
jgi:hypothetical protein